jgi:formylglycine-generating enzyme required for sulfatase activity
MVVIPVGSFQMGSNDGDDVENPVHPVRLKSFAIGRYEVTFDEYDQFAEALGKLKPDDNDWGRGKRPVINISWEDAVAYALWLSTVTGKHYRLPTEAEWEYAARAGTTSDYYWDGQGEAKDFAWFYENSEAKTQPVGKKKPNAFGLYDMSGNVWEWVQDCWHDNYDKAPGDGSAWQEPDNGDCPRRVVRGGSWFYRPAGLRSPNRSWGSPDYRGTIIGFRLAKD